MSEPMVYLSELMQAHLVVENGLFPVQGYHALAGLHLQGKPFDPQAPFDWVTPEAWAQRLARFWRALGTGQQNGSGPWQTSFELRAGREAANDPFQVGLWVKTFAPQDHVADQAAGQLAQTLLALCPPLCDPQAISTPEEMAQLWGQTPPQWLAEIRRKPIIAPQAEIETLTCAEVFAPWNPTPESLRQTWELIERLDAPLWLSVGVCPTGLFANEIVVFDTARDGQPRKKTAAPTPDERFRCDRLRQQAFLLRLRVGGESQAALCLAQAWAAALTEPFPAGHPCEHAVPAVTIVMPETSSDWEAANFNWLWGDFLPWGDRLANTPFGRLAALCDDQETGLLAGVWR
jgi:hypothetical protein